MTKPIIILLICIAMAGVSLLGLAGCGSETSSATSVPRPTLYDSSLERPSHETLDNLKKHLPVGMSKASVEKNLGKPHEKKNQKWIFRYLGLVEYTVEIDFSSDGKVTMVSVDRLELDFEM